MKRMAMLSTLLISSLILTTFAGCTNRNEPVITPVTPTTAITSTVAPIPTEVVEPTIVPTIEVVPTEAVLPTPIEVVLPTEIPEVTDEVILTETPVITEEPISTEIPTATLEPTATPKPTVTPEPTATPTLAPTPTPKVPYIELKKYSSQKITITSTDPVIVPFEVKNMGKYSDTEEYHVNVKVKNGDYSIAYAYYESHTWRNREIMIWGYNNGVTEITMSVQICQFSSSSSTGEYCMDIPFEITVDLPEADIVPVPITTPQPKFDPIANGYTEKMWEGPMGDNIMASVWSIPDLGRLSWTDVFEPTAVVVIDGTGEMWDIPKRQELDCNITINNEVSNYAGYRVGDVYFSEGITRIECLPLITRTEETVLHFPSTLKVIGEWSFRYMGAPISMNLPEGLLIIEDSAFLCIFKEFPKLPSTLRFVGHGGMQITNNLDVKEIVIPKSVRFIGYSGFGTFDLLEEYTHERTYILEGRSDDKMFYEGWNYLNRDPKGYKYGKKIFKNN